MPTSNVYQPAQIASGVPSQGNAFTFTGGGVGKPGYSLSNPRPSLIAAETTQAASGLYGGRFSAVTYYTTTGPSGI